MIGIVQCVKASTNIYMRSKKELMRIIDLQKQHNEIIKENKHNPSIVQTSIVNTQDLV